MDYEQNAVSKVVWPWVDRERRVGRPTGLPRQVRALIQTGIMLVISFLLHWWKPEHFMWQVVLGLSGVVLVSGLLIPSVFHGIERFGQALGRGVAVGLTWGLLVPFYYLCFVPGRFFLLLRGKDPMHRACPTDEASYWVKRPPVRSKDQYRKQH